MNRRTLLSLIPAVVGVLALPRWAAGVIPSKPKGYLGYNEPYDRSLVKVGRDDEGVTRAMLRWERVPGEAPVYSTACMQTKYFDLEQVHRALELEVIMNRKKSKAQVTTWG